MASYEVKMPSRGVRQTANVLSALCIVLFGVFLLLYYYTEIFLFGGERFRNMWLISMLFAFGLSALISGTLRKNLVTFWIAWPFIVCGMISLAVSLGWGSYGQLYPCYVLIPAVASAFTWLFSRAKASHLRIIIFFGAAAVACFLHSTGALDWWLALIIGVIAIGLVFLVNALTSRRGRWDDADN